MQSPILVITDVGLAAASIATPTGPFIEISSFSIGSAYGYTPTSADQGLNGTLLYSGAPTSYQNIGDNTINIMCRIPADAGPFDFGEVALYLSDGTMFAKMAFDSLQTKYSSLGTNVVSSYTFNCLLKLAQSVAVFKIDTSGAQPAVWTVSKWSDVYPPSLSANPDVPCILVQELDGYGNSTLLHQASSNKWTIGTNYKRLGAGAISNGTTTSVTIPASAVPSYITDIPSLNNWAVLETADGFFRPIATWQQSSSNYILTFNDPLPSVPSLGSNVTVWRMAADPTVYWQNLAHIPLAVAGRKGVSEPGNGITTSAAGVYASYGLLHDAPGVGRLVAGSEDLNTITTSGVYYWEVSGGIVNTPYGPVYQASYVPTNAPVLAASHMYVTGTLAGVIIQTCYPSTGTAPSGDSSYMWWRTYSSGAWGPWLRVGSGSLTAASLYTGTFTASPTAVNFTGSSAPSGFPPLTGPGVIHIVGSDDPNVSSYLYRNGTLQSQNYKTGSSGHGRANHDVGMFLGNDTISYTRSAAGVVTATLIMF